MSRHRSRPHRQPRRNQQQMMKRAIELMEQDQQQQQQPPRPYLITLPCACCGLGIERCACDWSEL